MKTLLIKLGIKILNLALMATVLNVNTTCMFHANQPKLPNGAEKFRKF